MPQKSWVRAKQALYEGNYPFTKVLIGVNLLTLTLYTFNVLDPLWLQCAYPDWIRVPWTILTYPFLSLTILGYLDGFLSQALLLYWAGGSLERAWGTRTFILFYCAMSIVSVLGLSLGAFLIYLPAVYAANWLPTFAMVMAFCAMNSTDQVCLWPVGGIPTKIFAIIVCLIAFFLYGESYRWAPAIGFFALTGCAAGHWWVRRQRWDRGYYATVPTAMRATRQPKKEKHGSRDDEWTWRNLNPFEWIARWRRRRQFMRLWKDSE